MSARSDHERIVRAFFDAYASRTNAAIGRPPRIDSAGVRDSFADYFVGASPKGVRGGRNGRSESHRTKLDIPGAWRHARAD